MYKIRPLSKQASKTRRRNLVAKITFAASALVLFTTTGLPAMHAYAATATVIAGLPSDGPLVDDIPATSAQFWNPAAVTTTSDGTIYIADKNHNEVRSIGADGIIHAAFGNGVAGCGTGSTQTQLYNPQSLARDEHDNIYVATGCGEIVKFTPGDPTGIVVAGKFDGTGNPNPVTHDGMNALDVTMLPNTLSYDSVSGALYFFDGATQRVLQLVDGILTIFAGTGAPGFAGDGGPATSAQFSFVSGMLFANGNLYVSDGGNCRVRIVAADGNISTIVGDGACHDANDTGPGTAASIEYSGPLALDANGMLYIGGSLSGSIFAYDTEAKTIVPVIQIISNTTGLAMDKDGNLLALHSGIDQQLFRVTGLPSPTPPADGKQHGRVTNVSWSVSPTTPLWNMEVTVKTSDASCPAVVVVAVGTWQKRTSLCSAGQTAPKSTKFNWKVFNDNHSFQPGSTPTVTAFIAKSDAPHYGGASTTLSVPGVPTIVGVGDSYLSGHHQVSEDLTCRRADDLPASDTTCSLVANDPTFSWVTRMATKLNSKAPLEWQYDYDATHLLAQSGATTTQMFEQGQISSMGLILRQHPDTWNVVAFDGGANDINFRGALKDFYEANALDNVFAKPWNLGLRSQCPDSEGLYQKLFGTEPGGDPTAPEPKAPVIELNLMTIIAAGEDASKTTRFLNMLYPYVVKSTNICSTDNTAVFPTQHGSASVINGLNGIHRDLAASNVLTLDLDNSFGDNPLPRLQLIRYYGYPHPDDGGQNKIAQQALKLLR